MPDSPGLGEEALNKAAETGLSSQLDEVEDLDVDIKTDPLKLLPFRPKITYLNEPQRRKERKERGKADG
ncbi:MAG: hypothetical protein SAK29_19375 [Scytonema sp. PMC 1069.18]|nr:hypothetical protein [Scytonema sp. PMC 1069.18]